MRPREEIQGNFHRAVWLAFVCAGVIACAENARIILQPRRQHRSGKTQSMGKLLAACVASTLLLSFAPAGLAADINTPGVPGSASPSAGPAGAANSGNSNYQGQSFSNTAPGQSGADTGI